MTKGVSTRTTSIGFDVMRLHYSADPDKDPATKSGRHWLEQAKTGMSDARWRKEFEIDYGALGGQRVFPQFEPSIHVVEFFQLPPEEWTLHMACDPHPRTPHAFLWLAINREGEMAIPFSWWPQDFVQNNVHATVKDYVEGVRKIEEYLAKSHLAAKVRSRVMDSAGKGMNASEEHSYFDAYEAAGLYFEPAKKNRDLSGFELINAAMKPTPFVVGDEQKLKPRLTIMPGNEELEWQLLHLRFAEWRGNVVDKDPPEKAEEKRRHLVDCLAYVLLDEPRFVERNREQPSWEPQYRGIAY
jgi:hypothetical protein